MDELHPTPKILVVDDNAANRNLAQATLEDEDYTVILAVSGAEAIIAFEREAPDCVLLDIRMPGLDGPATCELIRALPLGNDVPVVFLTAQRDVATFDRALRAGGDDFLTKPVQPSELVLRVQSALKLRKMKAELREHYDLVRRQRDDLMRLQLQKERLSQFIVHDLKNPVSTLDLCAQSLLRDRDLSDRAKTLANRIRADARTLLHMLLDLLDISRSDEGGLAPSRDVVDLPDLFVQTIAALDLQAQAASVRLAWTAAPLSIIGDSRLTLRILENLAANAIRHAPDHTAVNLSATLDGTFVRVGVADQGAGISADARDRSFEAFVQLDQGRDSLERPGRGLGLTFCKVAVEAQGGRIWIEDGMPGAVFYFTLPHAAEPTPSRIENSARGSS